MPDLTHVFIDPFFIVAHLPASIAFYCKRLEFAHDSQGPGDEPYFELTDADGHVLAFAQVRNE